MIMGLVFLTEFLISYCFIVKIFDKEIRHYWLFAISCIIIAILIATNIITDSTPILILALISNTILVFMIKDKYYKNFLNVLFAYIVTDSVIESIVILVKIIFERFIDIKLQSFKVMVIICNIVAIFCILIVGRVNHFKNRKNKKVPVAAVFVISCLVIWIMEFVATFIRFMQGFVQDKQVVQIADIVLIAGTISIILIAMLIFYIYQMNRELEKAYETEIELKEKQKEYYEDLLHREYETRRFRHETASHIGIVDKLLADSKYTEAQEYISKMNMQLKHIQNMVFSTGNEVFDAMLANYVLQLNSNVKVKVFGRISGKLKADNFLQCTIFSNVIKNAVEELNRNDEDDLKLFIHINPVATGVNIIVENTSSEKIIIDNNIKTSKSDKKLHGYGIKNLKESIMLAGGQLKLNYCDGIFTSEIILPYDCDN